MNAYIETFSAIWFQLNRPLKVRFVLLAVLFVVSSIFEMVSVGLLLPFFDIALNPSQTLMFFERVTNINAASLGLTSSNILLYSVITFAVVVIISGGFRLLALWQIMYFSSLSTHHISVQIFSKVIHQNIEFFGENSLTNLLSTGTIKVNEINNFLKHSATIFSGILISIGMLSILILTLPKYFVLVMSGLLLFYVIVTLFLSEKMRQNSLIIATSTTRITEKFSNSIEDIKRISVLNLYRPKINAFETDDINLRTAIAQSGFWASSPRFYLETIVLLFGLLLITVEAGSGKISNILPMLAVTVVGMQKTLPAVQSIYQSYSFIIRSYASALDCLRLLELPTANEINTPVVPCPFTESFILRNFKYGFGDKNKALFDQAEFAFKKGQRIGLIGDSGGGKSTLLEIIAGIRHIQSGEFYVDGRAITPANVNSWQQHIDYLPQKVFIPDASIDYIITGEIFDSAIDQERLQNCKEICLINFDETGSSDHDYAGAKNRYSGGQIQRLGLARSIYNDRDVLILDEATSALDAKTERCVIENILRGNPEKSIIVCTHNPKNLDGFDKIYNITAGIVQAEVK